MTLNGVPVPGFALGAEPNSAPVARASSVARLAGVTGVHAGFVVVGGAIGSALAKKHPVAGALVGAGVADMLLFGAMFAWGRP